MKLKNYRRLRTAMLFVAALPVFQLAQCSTAINRTLAGVGNALPPILINGFFDAMVQAVLSLLGAGNLLGGLGGGGGGGGGGFGGGGFGGS